MKTRREHIHILGIGGTFMAGVAILARALGHRVTGSDAGVYPPMSDLLAEQGISVMTGYDPAHLDPLPDYVVVGNALSRGNPLVEFMLSQDTPYLSGPAWIAQNVLKGRWVMAVAGTHGKTTVTSMLAWILDHAGLSPGFLVGGVPGNFGVSARLGKPPFFVVEADEYDTAFFDKRSKFVHYHPRTLVLNNLEFDHADIFPDLDAIKQQVHHLVRTVPGNGRIIRWSQDRNLSDVLAMGSWTPVESFGASGAHWRASLTSDDGSRFDVWQGDQIEATVEWDLFGTHNVLNALAAISAARHAGVSPEQSAAALGDFRNVKRRLEVRARIDGITVYDDFAHHPTAIARTLEALRHRAGTDRIIAVLEPRSNTMRLGVHKETLGAALAKADVAWVYRPPEVRWNLESAVEPLGSHGHVLESIDAMVKEIANSAQPSDHLIIMSNGPFEGLHERLIDVLRGKHG